MEMDSVSGARLTESPLDNNRDGVFNNSDFVSVIVGTVTLVVPVSGIQSEVGIAQTPGILLIRVMDWAEERPSSNTCRVATRTQPEATCSA